MTHPNTRGKQVSRFFRPLRKASVLAAAALAVVSGASQAGQNTIDCPLRDAPYSVDMPLIDMMASPAAKAVLEQELPELMKRIPAMFLSTEAPSLSTIMSMRNATALLRMPLPEETLAAVNTELAAVEVTDAAKQQRCSRYDNDRPEFEFAGNGKKVLVFGKVNGYDHAEGAPAALAAVRAIGKDQGWEVVASDAGGAFQPELLQQFDVVVWNNVSGDVLTLSQRAAFRAYIEQGGGFVGIHGSGGDFIYLWDWYRDELLGAQFIGHTMAPHYQDATIMIEQATSGIGEGLEPEWTIHDEWYSFEKNPRALGAEVVAKVDESSYTPEMSGISLRMGEDHPIAWTRCVGAGRSFYTAIGHLAGVYESEQNVALLRNALTWAAGAGKDSCSAD